MTDASSPFLYHLFDVIDVNHDQSLAFSEFLAVICTFCCYTELQMVKCQSTDSRSRTAQRGMGWMGWQTEQSER